MVLSKSIFRHGLLLLLAGMIRTPAYSAPEPAAPSDYDVKADYLYNFAQFVEWPQAKGENPDADFFCIGVLGEDPFGAGLETRLEGKIIRGKPLQVIHFKTAQEAMNCQVLYISISEQKNLPEIMEKLHAKPVLTVGELSTFTTQGGMIAFVPSEERVQFYVNVNAATESQLKISSDLLKVAKSVQGAPLENP